MRNKRVLLGTLGVSLQRLRSAQVQPNPLQRERLLQFPRQAQAPRGQQTPVAEHHPLRDLLGVKMKTPTNERSERSRAFPPAHYGSRTSMNWMDLNLARKRTRLARRQGRS